MRKLIPLIIITIIGCAKKEVVKPEPPQTEVGESKKIEEIILKAEEKEFYTVIKGDCLWKISGKKEIYNDPFMWPIIYEANREQIKNPDLIYPGQKLTIPRSGIPLEKIRDARRRAGAPKPYNPPPHANIPQ